MRSFMLGMPPSIVEAARVDGAGPGPRPSSRSCCRSAATRLITVGLFAFLFAWGDFIFALTLTTKGEIVPVTLGIYTYLGASTSPTGAR